MSNGGRVTVKGGNTSLLCMCYCSDFAHRLASSHKPLSLPDRITNSLYNDYSPAVTSINI